LQLPLCGRWSTPKYVACAADVHNTFTPRPTCIHGHAARACRRREQMGDTLPSATQYVRAYREHRRRVGFTSDVNAEMTSPSRIPSLGSILHCFITQPVAYLRADLALALSSFNCCQLPSPTHAHTAWPCLCRHRRSQPLTSRLPRRENGALAASDLQVRLMPHIQSGLSHHQVRCGHRRRCQTRCCQHGRSRVACCRWCAWRVTHCHRPTCAGHSRRPRY